MSSEQFVGRWKLVGSDQFEEYMKEVGVGLIVRKAAANVKPTLEIKVDGDTWHVNQLSTFKNTTLSFKLGEVRKGENRNKGEQGKGQKFLENSGRNETKTGFLLFLQPVLVIFVVET